MTRKSSKDASVMLGRRQTRGRREILQIISETEGHFDPQTLFEQMKAKGSRISRSSVYRAIPILVENGIIAEVERTEKRAHYERITGKAHHDHLICLGCGKKIEFYSPTLEMLQEEICQREGFKGVRHALAIMGYCRDCSC